MQSNVVLVTGATQGIGREIALASAKAGAAAVVVTGLEPELGNVVVAELEALGAKARFIGADLFDADAPDRIFDYALESFGRVDCLVNSAGITNRSAVADVSLDVWERLFAINARAPSFLMKRMIAHLKDRHSTGSILNILSMNAHGATPPLAIYAATKAALLLLTKNAAHAHRYDRIRINGINVGWVDSPAERQMQAVVLGKGEQWVEEANKHAPFGRLLSAQDVGRLALFLLSDASFPMTGSIVDQEQWVNGVRD